MLSSLLTHHDLMSSTREESQSSEKNCLHSLSLLQFTSNLLFPSEWSWDLLWRLVVTIHSCSLYLLVQGVLWVAATNFPLCHLNWLSLHPLDIFTEHQALSFVYVQQQQKSMELPPCFLIKYSNIVRWYYTRNWNRMETDFFRKKYIYLWGKKFKNLLLIYSCIFFISIFSLNAILSFRIKNCLTKKNVTELQFKRVMYT